jgi:uncharacterized repeat protein (TIGR01451 family)
MKAIKALIAVLSIVPVLAVASPVFADSPGQLTGGANVYQVKNLTQKTSYAATVSAACGEEVQYSVQLHNAGSGLLTNVVVTGSLFLPKVPLMALTVM